MVTHHAGVLVVHDTTGADGQDLVSGAETFNFSNGNQVARADFTQQVFIQPIQVSDTNGSNTATFFGDQQQEFEIQRLIDEIYLQAGVDVEWLPTNTVNNSFINNGNGAGTRSSGDLATIIELGDSLGVGHPDPIVLDFYFVERVPAFPVSSNFSANGLAFVDSNGIAMFTGNNLPGLESGRAVVARVAAHEIGHNLGLSHVSDPANLMDNGTEINSAQSSTIRSSIFTKDV